MPLNNYVTLGRSGLKVSRFCLGTMTFGTEWGFGCEAAEAHRILDAFFDHGGNFVDTANLYTKGASEEIIGDWIAAGPGRRDRIVLATKFGSNMHPGNPNGGGAGRRAIISACEASLKRLKTDYIDLYWQHWIDPFAPIEETMSALDDLVRSGKVRYLGFSDSFAWQVARAQTIAQWRGWSPLIALQVEYSLLERTVEGELIPMAMDLGLGVTTWGPLRGGVLSGKYSRDNASAVSAGRAAAVSRNLTDEAFAVLEVLREVAEGNGTTPARAALAWLMQRPGVAAPILGARTLEQFEENLAALDVELDEESLRRLDTISQPRLNFPANFLPQAANNTYAGMSVNGRQFGTPPR